MKKVAISSELIEQMFTTGYSVGGDHSVVVTEGIAPGSKLIGVRFEQTWHDSATVYAYFLEPHERVPGEEELEELHIIIVKIMNPKPEDG